MTAVTVEPDGSLTGPDGVTYARTPERVKKRALADEYMSSGAAVVTDVYPEGLRWFVGDEAKAMWDEIAPRLVTGQRPKVRDLQWTGHVWRADSGAVLLRFDGEH